MPLKTAPFHETIRRAPRRCERATPARRALPRALRARGNLVLRAPGPRTRTPICASSCRATARASRRSSTSSAASAAARRSSSSPSRPTARRTSGSSTISPQRLAAEEQQNGRRAHLIAYVESGSQGRAPVLRGQQVALRRQKDLDDAYDTIDRQIAIRSGMVEDLGDDSDGPRPPRRRAPAAAPGAAAEEAPTSRRRRSPRSASTSTATAGRRRRASTTTSRPATSRPRTAA